MQRPAVSVGVAGSASHSSASFPAWDPGHVHVWSDVTDGGGDIADDFSVLDRTEQARADRFRFERDRIRFVLGHAFARRVLSGYLGLDPGSVPIRPDAAGKPRLDPGARISFNISHDDGRTLVAVAPGFAVGVDIERLRPIPDAMAIAQGLFAQPEIDLLAETHPEARSRVFLALWTRKESFIKAAGGGLSMPLDAFSTMAADGAARGRVVGPAGPLPFAFAQLDRPRGYIGAVTVAGPQVVVRDMGASPSLHGGVVFR